MVEHLDGKLLCLAVGHVLTKPVCVETDLVHADQTDRGEVIIKGAEVALGIGIQPLVEQLCDNRALDLQRTCGNVHQTVEATEEVRLIGGEIGDLRHIDGHDADRAGALAAAEEAAGLFAQLAQIKPQTAAHRTHVARLHVAVDVVGKIRGAVFCGHFEQELVVLRLRPVEIAGDGVGGDGILEAASVCVALDHDLDEGAVDHIHFLLAVLILKGHFLAADDCGQLRHIVGDRPVEGDVGKRRLRTPAGGSIHAVDKRFDTLFDLLIRQVVRLHKGCKIGIEGGERLRARPFVLHDAEKIDHLIAQRGQVLRGRGGDLAGNSAQPLLNELPQRPARAVAREHRHIVDVHIAVLVCVGDLIIINLGEPVVCGDCAGIGEDQTADGVGDRRILLDAPILYLDVAVHQLLIVKERGLHVAELLPLAAIEDVRLGNIVIARTDQDGLHAVLNVLDGDLAVLDLRLKVSRYLERKKIDHGVVVLLVLCVKRLPNGV